VVIATGQINAGSLPHRAWRLVREWFDLHRAEVLENWNAAQAGQPCFPIDPL
jgi:hypothetical protein